ncbi:uncharacterized protein LOC112552893 [Pogonomyrmex barbatus]|uniref:Uncharacterized protein LOC112552893 n=1 Tax=Pogonomyrmex barbatus TaxID=144034 RepID=A0A8N1S851_9HYME|nr:uncharacterized protein LOC112552893 [Pogonomyrmex barbatus]
MTQNGWNVVRNVVRTSDTDILSLLQCVDELPPEMRSLLKLAVELPPVAHAAVSGALAAIGAIVLLGALMCLARAAKRQEKLHLSNPLPANATSTKNGQLNPAFSK